ncbi:aspartyl-phosphate phosphatase Spo0E family protein [Brevibacillus massiliensis]|uniref:aspartyl-phosphate phosphatase Spo0E family protein n=1 Tax=Brevibacillus massiliensis TaxID=1118054 RepID=UPI0009D9F837|nr:aspartyl-phosphate phosphatase Spo0E family protein [Brevibacillus massiliensis]
MRHQNKISKGVAAVCIELVLRQIEELRQQLNEQYKHDSAITPELVELSAKLDQLLNKLHHSSIECN